ncbi:MAG: ImmA/IrrE family metallo-endopeptidase [Rhizobiales bacterium]|nr:ImmA/IrrE family metallo-endopeptidase [Hyphomicrobiales bacterium]
MKMTLLDLIEENSVSPPVNVEAIIRGLGIELNKKAELDAGIAGEIARLDSGKYRISANKDDHYFRQRFTLAHELAHFVFHRDLIGDGVDDDKLYRSTEGGNFYNTKIKKQHETEANRFAAVILMPKDLVIAAFERQPDVKALAKDFQVSPAAMEIRLRGLGSIN